MLAWGWGASATCGAQGDHEAVQAGWSGGEWTLPAQSFLDILDMVSEANPED